MKTTILQYFAENFGLDEVSALDMYHAYLSTLEGYRGKFDDLAEKGDLEGLRHAFHSVKGCALNCGDAEMSHSALEGERAAKTGDLPACRSHIPAVVELMDKRLTER